MPGITPPLAGSTDDSFGKTFRFTAELGSNTRESTGYTKGMKTAVSVPDEVFDEAEHLAKHLKISRSELYAKALAEFVSRHAPDAITDSFNHVCAEIQGEPDPAFQRAARKVLENTEW